LGAQPRNGIEWKSVLRKGERWHLFFLMVRGLIESSSNGNGKLEDVAIKMFFPRL
jgi:hypothetical protein